MTLRQIEFFVAVIECKSINKASDLLNVSQQAVSKSLRSLEDELGCPLMLRSNGGVVPTNYGTYVLQEFQSILHKRDYLISHLNQMVQNPQEPLTIGMSFGILGALPPHFLNDFIATHPNIRFTYTDSTDAQLQKQLSDGSVDAAVIAGPFTNVEFRMETLKKERSFLVIPKGNPLYTKKNVTLADLSSTTYVMMSAQFNSYHNFLYACRHAGFTPNIILKSNDFNSLREQGVQLQSLAICPEHAVRKSDPSNRYVPFPDPYFTWDIMFAIKETKLMTEPINEFYRCLKMALGEDSGKVAAQAI